MTVQELINTLKESLSKGEIKEDMDVVFAHRIHESGHYSDVDYLLTKQHPNSVVLCYDDGNF